VPDEGSHRWWRRVVVGRLVLAVVSPGSDRPTAAVVVGHRAHPVCTHATREARSAASAHHPHMDQARPERDQVPRIRLETPPGTYQPGVCNIGPAEIARRRRVGHLGLIAAILLFALLIVLDLPPITRLLITLPAGIAASGYLQARLHFCAGFGSAGVYNFGELGPRERVEDADARAADRARSLRIYLASLAIGLAAGVIAVLLPV
jgi:hypothetical protein